MSLETTLAELEPMLYDFNYEVFLRAYPVSLQPGSSTAAHVAAALGSFATLARETESSWAELLAEVEECLRYEGDSSSGPKPAVLKSAAFNERVARLKTELRSAAFGQRVTRVQILEGHPAYPVFWDFTYVVVGQNSFVLLGSSSD